MRSRCYRGRGRSLSNRAALDFNFLSGTLDPRLTVSRPGIHGFGDANGWFAVAPENTLPLSYDPMTLQPLGRVSESSLTNLLLNSGTVGIGAGWADGAGGNDNGNLVVEGNAAIAPDGTLTATRINDNSTVTVLGRQQPVTIGASNKYFTASVFAKAGSSSVAAMRVTVGGGANVVVGDAVINLLTGATQWRYGQIGFAIDVQPWKNGWYRLLATVKDSLANGNTFITAEFRPAFAPTYSDTLQLSHTGSAYFWGAQIASSSTGKVLGSYTSTAAAQATRFADVLTLPQAHGTALLNTPEFTIYAEYSVLGLNGSNQFIYDITDGTIGREVGLYVNNSGISSIVNTGGTNAVPYMAGAPSVGTIQKHALSVKSGQLLTALNGANAGGGAPSPMPTLDRIRFGNRVDGSFPAFAAIRKLKMRYGALTQVQINAMTI